MHSVIPAQCHGYTSKNFWTGVLGSVVIQLYAGECLKMKLCANHKTTTFTLFFTQFLLFLRHLWASDPQACDSIRKETFWLGMHYAAIYAPSSSLFYLQKTISYSFYARTK